MSDLMAYAAALADAPERALPPVADWNPPDRGPIDIVIRADGVWVHEGAPIKRARLVRLFASILKREGDAYFLVTPAEKRRVIVEDVPFVAVSLDTTGRSKDRQLIFTTNLNETITAGSAHPLSFRRPSFGADRNAGGKRSVSPVPVPYIMVRAGLEARLARPAYYALADLAAPREGTPPGPMGVWSDGVFFAFPDDDTDQSSR